MTKREDVLNTAKQAITQDRNVNYGNPEDNFGTIAALWNAYLHSSRSPYLTSVDVAAMMILMKVSRILTSPDKFDHWVDIAGYSACGFECASTDNK